MANDLSRTGVCKFLMNTFRHEFACNVSLQELHRQRRNFMITLSYRGNSYNVINSNNSLSMHHLFSSNNADRVRLSDETN